MSVLVEIACAACGEPLDARHVSIGWSTSPDQRRRNEVGFYVVAAVDRGPCPACGESAGAEAAFLNRSIAHAATTEPDRLVE